MRILQQVVKFQVKLVAKAAKLGKATKQVKSFSKMLKEAVKEGNKEMQQFAKQGLKQAQTLQKEFIQEIQDMFKIANRVMQFFEVGSKTLEGLEKIDKARISFIRAELAEVLGELDAEIAVLDNLIKTLRKVIDSMMQSISSLGEWITETSSMQNSLWRGMAETVESIANAND